MAGDCAWHGGSAGSKPAIKPERPETKDKASEGRFRRKRASGARVGAGDGGVRREMWGYQGDM
ncbi:MAG: hypothetical protein DRP66_11790 [Planctomycetota bacterium]|nr:MAG: hypothetical protein DRP66_11790 [Planctomycetota bacterium]